MSANEFHLLYTRHRSSGEPSKRQLIRMVHKRKVMLNSLNVAKSITPTWAYKLPNLSNTIVVGGKRRSCKYNYRNGSSCDLETKSNDGDLLIAFPDKTHEILISEYQFEILSANIVIFSHNISINTRQASSATHHIQLHGHNLIYNCVDDGLTVVDVDKLLCAMSWLIPVCVWIVMSWLWPVEVLRVWCMLKVILVIRVGMDLCGCIEMGGLRN